MGLKDIVLKNVLERLGDNQAAKEIAKKMLSKKTDKDFQGFMEVDTIIFDGKEYIIKETFEVDGNKYCFIVNIEDPIDYTFRKEEIIDGKEYVVGLDSEEEFDKVFDYFQKNMIPDDIFSDLE